MREKLAIANLIVVFKVVAINVFFAVIFFANFVKGFIIKANIFEHFLTVPKPTFWWAFFAHFYNKKAPGIQLNIKGDFVLSGSESYFKVKDFIVSDVSKHIEYEKDFNFKVGIYNTNRKLTSDIKLIKSIFKFLFVEFWYKFIKYISITK